MSRIQEIEVRGFRRLKEVDIDFRNRPLAVLIGANGSGKTSFLEAVRLIAASIEDKLASEMAEIGGYTANTRQDTKHELALAIKVSTPGEKADEEDEIAHIAQYVPDATGRGITKVRDEFRLNQALLDRLQIPAEEPNVKHQWEQIFGIDFLRRTQSQIALALSPCVLFRPVDAGPRSAIRLAQTVTEPDSPGANGESLVSRLFVLKESMPVDRFERIEQYLQAGFPEFEKLSFRPVPTGSMVLGWKEKDYNEVFYAGQLSEGTLRFLWLTTLLLGSELPPVTMIDEPEMSLHPALIALLPDLFREAAQRTLLLVATQSPELIRHLQPKEVLVCDTKDGCTTLNWADRTDLQSWLKDYTLDELWNMNLIGGRS